MSATNEVRELRPDENPPGATTCGYVHETGGWIGTPDPITYRGEVVR